MAEKIEIKIGRYKIRPAEPLEREIEVFQVEVHRGDGVWIEEFVSEDRLRAFLRGVQAGSLEYVHLPEIPQQEANQQQAKQMSQDVPEEWEGEDIPF